MHNNGETYFIAVLLTSFAATACGGKSSDRSGSVDSPGSTYTGGSSSSPSSASGGGMAAGGAIQQVGGGGAADAGAGAAAVTGGSGAAITSSASGGTAAPAAGGALSSGGLPSTSWSAVGGTVAPVVGGALSSGGLPSTSWSTVSTGAGGTFTEPVSTVLGLPAVDILLMVDNSGSMADKQQLLAQSIPRLIDRLVQPNCLDSSGAVVGKSQFGVCGQGSIEFKPVNDLHLAVITSSLGDHGANSACAPGTPSAFADPSTGDPLLKPDDVNDKGRLMASLARGAAALASDTSIVQSAGVKLAQQGFLAWSTTSHAPTATDLASAESALRDMVAAAGEQGCGFESQLESWFRFLVDPVPPILPITRDETQQARRLGSDDALLLQRSAFLRPNSTLAIVMFTDENDCSLRDTDVAWVATETRSSITTGSAACMTNPNDPCCYSCTNSSPPTGCASGCASAAPMAPDDSAYQANLRCWQQKRRFGYEFLYPISRYVVGLTQRRLCPDQTFGDMDCNCTHAKLVGAICSPGARNLPNPLFSSVMGLDNAGNPVIAATNVAPRADSSSIYLAGILGVPWQDVGYLDTAGRLVYIPVTDAAWTSGAGTVTPVAAAPKGIWTNIHGDDNANIVPGDPHMVESLTPREGLAAPDSARDADPINGHEWNTGYLDFQYACTFPLPIARACECSPEDAGYASCKYLHPNDCCDLAFVTDGRGNPDSGNEFKKPLCDGRMQVAAKAYPGLREIAVLRDYAMSPDAVGHNSIVTSICARDVTGDPSNPGYGYNPAIDALVSRMKKSL